MEQFNCKYNLIEAVKFTGTETNIQEIKTLLGDRFIEYSKPDEHDDDTFIEFQSDCDFDFNLILWLNNYLLPVGDKFLVITEDIFEELFIKTN